MMSTQPNTLNSLLEQFGLDSQEAEIYLYLVRNYDSSALEISRALHMGRTTVYRILDRLQSLGLVNRVHGELGLKFQTTPLQNIDLLVLNKEQEIAALRRSTPLLIDQLQEMQSSKQQGSKIVSYKGVEGLRQITWNSLQAKGELLTMEMDVMDGFLDADFAEKVRMEFLTRKVHIRELTNQNYLAPWTEHQQLADQFWQGRYLSPKQLKINFEILIYNDVCAMYNYKDGQIFCVEVYNQQLADMQRSLFEFMWGQGLPLKSIGKGGESRVEV